MEAFFEFEKPIVNLEKQLLSLRELARQGGVDFSAEIAVLEKKVTQLIDETYSRLTPWQKVQLSRHPNRPYTRDYVDALFPGFMELQGDRLFQDDQAILGGVALWPPAPLDGSNDLPEARKVPVLILGHQKGRTTKQKMERNFAMAKPEGYRKAMRLMDLAHRSKMPILTFIDTPGAYPGIDAEERGQSQAIAESIHKMFELDVPIVSVIIGEGGSGGALAIGVGNRVLMQEYSTYSVISPESCASILWSDSSLAERASEKLKMNPPDLLRLGVIDAIVPEPKGGAHRDWPGAFRHLREALVRQMNPLLGTEAPRARKTAKAKTKKSETALSLIEARIAKFRAMGERAIGHAPTAREEGPHA
jgi:acetyl-CoA carboxylase carboxyl transferase subunit alpha